MARRAERRRRPRRTDRAPPRSRPRRAPSRTPRRRGPAREARVLRARSPSHARAAEDGCRAYGDRQASPAADSCRPRSWAGVAPVRKVNLCLDMATTAGRLRGDACDKDWIWEREVETATPDEVQHLSGAAWERQYRRLREASPFY